MPERYVKLPNKILIKDRGEMRFIKPIFDIMNDRKDIFENHWQARSEAYEKLTVADINYVLMYTEEKLIELMNYLNTIKIKRQSKAIYSFYMGYVELLLRYHNGRLDSYPGTYMHLYSELLLGAQRYQNIMNELIELGCNIEEVGSIT